jgi:hypothetical protein
MEDRLAPLFLKQQQWRGRLALGVKLGPRGGVGGGGGIVAGPGGGGVSSGSPWHTP